MSQRGFSNTSSSSGRYLFYALGEIFLVVVGILIALKINNWNQERQDQIKSREYHSRMIEDLDRISLTLQRDSRRAEELRVYLGSAARILQKDDLTAADKDSLDFSFINYNQFLRIYGSLTSFDEMKSSGHLGLIYNKELRKRINEYLVYLGGVSEVYDQISKEFYRPEIFDKYLSLQIGEKREENKVIYNFEDLRSNKELINTFTRFAFNWQTKRDFSIMLVQLSESLKEEIEKELE